MKFTKFIPAALALALAITPAFATGEQGNRSLSDTFEINVPEYFNISRVSSTLSPTSVTVGTDMASLTWEGSMGVTYKVVNNAHNKTFYLKATSPTTGNPKAFAVAFGTPAAAAAAANTIKVAFCNTESTAGQFPDQTAVNNALGGTGETPVAPSPELNKNVFATTMNLAAVTPTDGGIVASRTVTGQEIVYVIHEGTYQFAYTFANAAEANTFSPHDEMGKYQVVLTITDGTST